MSYRVHLEFPEGSLDQKGFLLDNLSFQDFFQACQYRFPGGLEMSCELFAKYCCEQFCHMSQCHRVTVEICGVPGVWVGHIMESQRYCEEKRGLPNGCLPPDQFLRKETK